jgi:hypothetical protein
LDFTFQEIKSHSIHTKRFSKVFSDIYYEYQLKKDDIEKEKSSLPIWPPGIEYLKLIQYEPTVHKT